MRVCVCVCLFCIYIRKLTEGEAIHQLVEEMLNDVNIMLGANSSLASYSVEKPRLYKSKAWYTSEVCNNTHTHTHTHTQLYNHTIKSLLRL